MAADIVILDIREQTGGLTNIRFACWFTVANPYPASTFISAYPDINTDPTVGASAANYPAQLQSGALVEEVFNVLVPSVVISSSWATVEVLLLAIHTARAAYKAGSAPAVPTPGLKYKILHDSVSGWSA